MRTKQLIAKIKRKVCLNKKRKSANKIANAEGCSITTVDRVIHADLSLNTYTKIRVHTLTVNQIQRKNSFAHWIKNRFSREKCRSILFFDVKWFVQDCQYNRKKHCVYVESRETKILPKNTSSHSKSLFFWDAIEVQLKTNKFNNITRHYKCMLIQ